MPYYLEGYEVGHRRILELRRGERIKAGIASKEVGKKINWVDIKALNFRLIWILSEFDPN